MCLEEFRTPQPYQRSTYCSTATTAGRYIFFRYSSIHCARVLIRRAQQSACRLHCVVQLWCGVVFPHRA